jgi:hypothetical protein
VTRSLFLAAAAAVSLLPAAAQAALLTFTIGGDYRASFTLDDARAPDEYIGNTGTVFWDVDADTSDGRGSADIGFFDASLGGGLSIIDYADFAPYFVADGPQLYSGTVQAPVFNLGTFQLQEYQGPGRYTLTVARADAVAVPEPAGWLAMVAGLGLAGGILRARRRARSRAAA